MHSGHSKYLRIVCSPLFRHGQNKSPSDFDSSVTIDTTPGKNCEDRDYGETEKVPLSCFYFYDVKDEHDLNSLPIALAKIVGSVPPASTGTYLILVAVHVITKETPDWVWATFWWHNLASEGPYAANRPGSVRGPWRHFLMDTTLSEQTPWDPEDGKNKICFNPYLEAQFNNGVVSNCVQCHKRATFPGNLSMGLKLGLPGRDGMLTADPHYFDGSVKTDFMWSIASPRDVRVVNFLKDLQSFLSAR